MRAPLARGGCGVSRNEVLLILSRGFSPYSRGVQRLCRASRWGMRPPLWLLVGMWPYRAGSVVRAAGMHTRQVVGDVGRLRPSSKEDRYFRTYPTMLWSFRPMWGLAWQASLS